MIRFLVVLISITTVACSTHTVYIAGLSSVDLSKVQPNIKPMQRVYELWFSDKQQQKSQSLLLNLESKVNELKVVGLTISGQKLFQIVHDKNGLQYEAETYFKNKLPIMYFYTDLLLSLHNSSAEIFKLSKDIVVKDTTTPNRLREIKHKTRSIIIISYSTNNVTDADIKYNNLHRGYRFSLKAIPNY